MSSWLGIDHGTKRIGVAVGDTVSGIATPLEVIPAQPLDQAIRRIGELARQYAVEGIVVGLPMNMDGSEGSQAALAREIAEQLTEGIGLPVRLFDERLSSFAADQALAGLLTRKGKKARQDALAAATMLQDFLNSASADGPTTIPQAGEK
jgi:putative Holliday junction resolvase